MQRIAKWLASWIGWLELRSRWSELRALGQSPLVRASVLMPAFGYILLLNDNVHQYLTIKYDGWLLNYLPSLWRIWLLFYGTFSLAIGSLIFSASCPVQIKRYESAFKLADAELRHLMHQHQMIQVRDDLRSLYNGMSKWEQSICPQELRFDHPTLGITTADIDSAILINLWTAKNIKCPRLRIFVFSVFWAGLVLLAVPATITFLQVTIVLLTHL